MQELRAGSKEISIKNFKKGFKAELKNVKYSKEVN